MLRFLWQAVRAWTDDQLQMRVGRRPLAFAPGAAPLAFIGLLEGTFQFKRSNVAVGIGIAWLVLWFCFVVWRMYRNVRLFAINGDRRFDRADKFELPGEYADTESSESAKHKRRRESE